MKNTKSGKLTLLMSVLMSAPGPLVVGIGLLMGKSSTQLADFFRRSAELLAIIFSFVIYLITTKEGKCNEEKKRKLENLANLFVACVMCICSVLMIVLAFFSESEDKGSVIPGLAIALLGVVANTIFWIRYTKMNKSQPNKIFAVQARLYGAKSLVDGCVTIALTIVAIFPSSPVAYYFDLVGSIIVAIYLFGCGIKTFIEYANSKKGEKNTMIRQLTLEDAEQFRQVIIDMYSHLQNLEWFSPMPFDEENVKGMIQHPRFYIIGYFEGDKLCGVSSLDYKCGKLIGKIDFPKDCNTDKLVELAFNMVRFDSQGQGIMKKMIAHLLEKIKNDGFEWVFSKVHKDNFASSKSLMKNGLEIYCDYVKPVKRNEFIELSSQDFFSPQGKINAEVTLKKFPNDDQDIIVDYNILIKKL